MITVANSNPPQMPPPSLGSFLQRPYTFATSAPLHGAFPLKRESPEMQRGSQTILAPHVASVSQSTDIADRAASRVQHRTPSAPALSSFLLSASLLAAACSGRGPALAPHPSSPAV